MMAMAREVVAKCTMQRGYEDFSSFCFIYESWVMERAQDKRRWIVNNDKCYLS